MFEVTFFKSYKTKDGQYRTAAQSQYPLSAEYDDFTSFARALGTHRTLSDKSEKGQKGIMLCKFQEGCTGRVEQNIMYHTGIAVDLDEGVTQDLVDKLKVSKYTLLCYTTCSSTAKHIKIRVLAPLKKPVTSLEYRAYAESFCKDLGITQYDPCSLKANQIMYAPETLNKDEAFGFFINGEPYWTENPVVRKKAAEKHHADLKDKPLLIQAFCTVISIEEILESCGRYEFVSNGCYRLAGSVSPAGVKILSDGTAYSHHSTDDWFLGTDGERHALNAFDLWRKSENVNYSDPHLKEKVFEAFPQVKPEYVALVLASNPTLQKHFQTHG